MRQPSSLKIGVSGVRGVIGESLSPHLVTAYAAAFGTYAGAGPIVIGTDSRPSREMVKQAVVAGLLSVGCAPIDLGIVPTPSLQWQLRKLGGFGGIAITASHNPDDWNALKFYGADGMALRENQHAELTDLYHQGVYPRVEADRIATIRSDETAIDNHLAAVLAAVDADAIRARAYHVAVDACNGAASTAAPRLLELLGCHVTALHTDAELPFPHDPEPSPEHLGDLGRAVTACGAEVGFALDADGDRLAIVDGDGQPLGEDCTLALAARHRLPRGAGPLVISASTSRMLDHVAAEAGRQLVRTMVGEVYVVAAMLEHGAVIGGEGNGGVILPEVNPGRDGLVGMALLLEALAVSGATVSELRDALPRYQIVKRALPCPLRELGPSLRRLRRAYADEQIELTDGVTVVFGDRWLQARPSKTEPLLRIIAEAPDRDVAARMAQEAAEILRPVG